jgi:hypothetical protein
MHAQPNYGCCTVNFGQGLPKYATRMGFMDNTSGGFALIGFAPAVYSVPISRVARTWMRHAPTAAKAEALLPLVRSLDERKVPSRGATAMRLSGALTVNVTGIYPFDDTFSIAVSGLSSEFDGYPFSLRIPGWATNALITVNGVAQPTPANGTILRLSLPYVASGAPVVITVDFQAEVRVVRGFNGAASIYWGALLFSLPIGEHWVMLNHYAFNSSDWNVLNTSDWRYALVLPSDADPSQYLTVHRNLRQPSSIPYQLNASPVTITASIRPFPAWSLQLNSVAAPPPSPVCVSPSDQCGAPLAVTLVPYGATNLRIAAIPTSEQ